MGSGKWEVASSRLVRGLRKQSKHVARASQAFSLQPWLPPTAALPPHLLSNAHEPSTINHQPSTPIHAPGSIHRRALLCYLCPLASTSASASPSNHVPTHQDRAVSTVGPSLLPRYGFRTTSRSRLGRLLKPQWTSRLVSSLATPSHSHSPVPCRAEVNVQLARIWISEIRMLL